MQSCEPNAGLRLMTYNIHRWEGFDGRMDVGRLSDVIASTNSDVIVLNEVLHPVFGVTSWKEPLAEMASQLGMYFAFGPSGWRDYGPGWHGQVGNAILSRYPLVNVSNIWLPRARATKQRSLLGATLDDGPARGLTAFVTHLDHLLEVTRMWQVEGVLNRLGQQGPHFLAGDFNTPGFTGSRSRRLLPPVLRLMHRAGYADAFFTVGSGCGRTFPARSPIFRLDFLFVPRRWASGLRGAHAPAHDLVLEASDHRPLVVDWGWPGAHQGAGTCMECISSRTGIPSALGAAAPAPVLN